MAGTDLYIRPCGLVCGPDAAAAVVHKAGLPLAGNAGLSWTCAQVSEDGGKSWAMRGARELAASKEDCVAKWVERLSAPRGEMCGLDMGQPQVMGILNITPDSFSDGGVHHAAGEALAAARKMHEHGASLLDVGGESTRPGAEPVSLEEEWVRIEPVIAALVEQGIKVSSDTRKGEIMSRVAKLGVCLLNDVSALTHEADAADAAIATGLPVCLMHAQGDPRTMQNNPQYDDVLVEVYDWLEARIETLVAAGLERDKIMIDPGLGFGKSFAHNLELLQGLSLFHGLGVPVLLGASRKGFIGAVTGEKVAARRQAGSASVALHAVMAGAQLVRVHDVRETVHVIKAWQASVGINRLS